MSAKEMFEELGYKKCDECISPYGESSKAF